jgi:hypothetical protein
MLQAEHAASMIEQFISCWAILSKTAFNFPGSRIAPYRGWSCGGVDPLQQSIGQFLDQRDASASEKGNSPGKSCQGQLRSLICRRGVGKAASDRGRKPKPDVTVRPLQGFAARESVEN